MDGGSGGDGWTVGRIFFGVTLTFQVVWKLAKNCLGIIFALKRPLFTHINGPKCVDQLQFFSFLS